MSEDEKLETPEAGAESQAETPASEGGETPKVSQPRDELGRFLAKLGVPDDGPPEVADKGRKPDEGKAAEAETTPPTEKPTAEKAAGDEEGQEVEEKPWWTPRQARLAAQFGYTEDDLAGMDGKTFAPLLERTSQSYSRKMSELGRLKQEQPKVVPTEALKRERAADGTGDEEVASDEKTFDLETLSFDEFDGEDDPQTRRKLNALAIAVKEMRGVLRERQTTKEDADVDGFFLKLAKEQPGVFQEYGDSLMGELDEDDPAAKARNELLEKAKAIQVGFKVAGQEITIVEALDWALSHVGKETIKKAEKEKLRGQIARRRQTAMPKPAASRASAIHDPLEAMNREMEAFERTHGITVPP